MGRAELTLTMRRSVSELPGLSPYYCTRSALVALCESCRTRSGGSSLGCLVGTDSDIAQDIGQSRPEPDCRVRLLYSKLGVSSRTELRALDRFGGIDWGT